MGDALVSHTLFCAVQSDRTVDGDTIPVPCGKCAGQSGTASPLHPPFPVFLGESSLSAGCRRRHRLGGRVGVSTREGRCGTTSRAELFERPGEPGCENNPIRGLFQGFQRPTWSGHPGRNPQDGFVPRRTTHGSPQGQKRRRRHGHGEAMCDGRGGRHPCCQQQTA
jgi:hypothetical protein